MCGAAEADLGERLQIHHLDGRESDSDPRNLLPVCRNCNQRADRELKAHGLGIKTRQFNPSGQGAKSLGAWLAAVLTVTGQAPQMDLQKAIDLHSSASFCTNPVQTENGAVIQ